jgi:hypothetical protein
MLWPGNKWFQLDISVRLPQTYLVWNHRARDMGIRTFGSLQWQVKNYGTTWREGDLLMKSKDVTLRLQKTTDLSMWNTRWVH